jgi:hypothetical protein
MTRRETILCCLSLLAGWILAHIPRQADKPPEPALHEPAAFASPGSQAKTKKPRSKRG